jgi:glycosyltransferase involved in cell wall biosynthesis
MLPEYRTQGRAVKSENPCLNARGHVRHAPLGKFPSKWRSPENWAITPRVMGPQLSIVVPLYNEVENVRALYDELVAELQKLGKSYEILFVDDGSTDGTTKLLLELAAQNPSLILVRFRRNYGQTAALSAGIERARGEVIIPMDGDLQNDPADIGKLLAKMGEGFECVSGWRRHRQDKAVTRRFPSQVANWLISKVSGIQLHDYGCTLKAYRRDVIEGVRLYGEMHRFIPVYAAWQGAHVAEIEVHHRARRFGVSKYGLNRIFKVMLDLLLVRFLFQYMSKPIYVFGGFGLVSIFGSFLAAGTAVVLKLTHLRDLVATPLPLLFLTGFLSVLMGLLAELMIRTYYESQDKRPYLVAEVINAPAPSPSNDGPTEPGQPAQPSGPLRRISSGRSE